MFKLCGICAIPSRWSVVDGALQYAVWIAPSIIPSDGRTSVPVTLSLDAAYLQPGGDLAVEHGVAWVQDLPVNRWTTITVPVPEGAFDLWLNARSPGALQELHVRSGAVPGAV